MFKYVFFPNLLHPRRWRPQWFRVRPLGGQHQLLECGGQIIVDDILVEKMPVQKIDAFRRFDHFAQFFVLFSRKRNCLKMSSWNMIALPPSPHRESTRIGLIECRSSASRRPRRLQPFERWRRLDVHNVRFQLRCAQRFDCLIMRCQHANAAGIHNGTHALRRCAIQMALVFAVLDEFPGPDVSVHFLARNKQILASGHFAGANRSRCVWR